ncbi:MAG: glutamine synthetase family protein [Eubacteriales bacterium]|nr:glutamine synthetase family protein [Eubacteriales bacterium]
MRTFEDAQEFVEEEDVKFIRLSFVDVRGKMRNIAIMPENLKHACEYGIPFDSSAMRGRPADGRQEYFLFPDISTLGLIPWRPVDGRVARMFCDIRDQEGKLCLSDSRRILKEAVEAAAEKGIWFETCTDFEFYLFHLNERGEKTDVPLDYAGYFDVAPEDKGENIRREISFELVDMGIQPRSSHHEEGPGQNEVDFDYSDPVSAADNAEIFRWMVKNIAASNGLWADFSPKPIADQTGDGVHYNFVLHTDDGEDAEQKVMDSFAAGILRRAREITLFLNPVEDSYKRLGVLKAPKYVAWTKNRRDQFLCFPVGRGRRSVELRSPDPASNPYIAMALSIYAGLEGVEEDLLLDPEQENARGESVEKIPGTLKEAYQAAKSSEFVRRYVPDDFFALYENLEG